MRILITNDDGIAAPGLRWLASAVVAVGHDVVVAAPAHEASGASAALSAVFDNRRLAITPARLFADSGPTGNRCLSDVDGETYQVRASPSYIVILAALATFGPPRHVV